MIRVTLQHACAVSLAEPVVEASGGIRGSGRYGVDAALALDRTLVVLRGATGTGKTAVLRALAARGAQILDLEALAGHRGSAFGGLGLPPQPSHGEFQQSVAAAWAALSGDRAVVCEHESRYLGSVGIPTALDRRIAAADGIELAASTAERVARIVDGHAGIATAELVAAVARLRRRLGAPTVITVEAALRDGRRSDAVCALLPYYDRAYAHQRGLLPPPRVTLDALATGDLAARDAARATQVLDALAALGHAP